MLCVPRTMLFSATLNASVEDLAALALVRSWSDLMVGMVSEDLNNDTVVVTHRVTPHSSHRSAATPQIMKVKPQRIHASPVNAVAQTLEQEIDQRLIWWSWRKSGDWMTSAWQQYKSEEDFRNSMSCAYMWPGIYKFNTKSGGLWIAKSMKLWKLNGPEQLRFLSCLIFLLICSEGVCESPECRAAWGSLAQPLWKQNDVPQRSVSLDE